MAAADDATELPARIVCLDDALLVLDKPSGVPVLADRSGMPCLWDALVAWGAARGTPPLAVHRIDKGTSGLLLVALTAPMQRQLGAAFENGTIGKYYSAVSAAPLPCRGAIEIDLPISQGRKNRWRIAGQRDAIRERHRRAWRTWFLPNAARSRSKPGKDALTRVRTVVEDGSKAWLCVRPHTGRTHQIRVHLAWIGCPLLGDPLYGTPDADWQRASRLALHCHRLVLPHLPGREDRPRVFVAPLPEDFRALLPARAPRGA
ncbi:MAG TPA: RluA family pseudouridine synthase [Pseudomonadales bacterium]|nr:RluA family pseudouridine synthase [Pseudomonadales bacterium]